MANAKRHSKASRVLEAAGCGTFVACGRGRCWPIHGGAEVGIKIGEPRGGRRPRRRIGIYGMATETSRSADDYPTNLVSQPGSFKSTDLLPSHTNGVPL